MNYTYGTVTGSNYGITFSPTQSETKPRTPSGLFVTQAVQTKDGWRGQVIVDKEIVWEGTPESEGEDAIQSANSRVVQAFKQLFVQTQIPDLDEDDEDAAERVGP